MAQGSSDMKYLALAVAIGAALGCQSRGASGSNASSARPVQAAVGLGMHRTLRLESASVTDPEARAAAGRAAQMPALTLHGSGPSARLDVRADDDHQNPLAVRAGAGWALTWSDRDHARAFFARTDDRGRAIGVPIAVRVSESAEEDVWAPSVAFTGSEYGIAWADPANGRVNFARFDANGRRLGGITVLHEGLEMPLATRAVWNGSEYGVAVAMSQGIYFVRVRRDGERLGHGVIVAEGNAVASLDELSASSSGFALQWRDAGENAAAHRTRLSREGRPLETTGAIDNALEGVRFAHR